MKLLLFFSALVAVSLAEEAPKNDAGKDVTEFLQHYGYYNPNAFGANLKHAISAYQRFYGLKETGVADEATKKEMAKPRCGFPDVLDGGNGYYATSTKWRKHQLTYRFLNYGRRLGSSTVRQVIRAAFTAWEKVTPLRFKEVGGSRSDLTVGFYSRDHRDGFPFDGPNRVLAHAYQPSDGRVHFDGDESWDKGMLYEVGVHEIGHAIGLDHSRVRGAVMWPSWIRGTNRLTNDDIRGIQSLYGRGTGGTGTGGTGTGGTGTGGGSCRDSSNDCRKYYRNCRSSNTAWRNYMQKYCRKTCRYC